MILLKFDRLKYYLATVNERKVGSLILDKVRLQ